MKLQKEAPQAKGIALHNTETKDTNIYVEGSNSEGLYYNSVYRFFDQNTLEEIESKAIFGKYKDAKFTDRIILLNYDIRV